MTLACQRAGDEERSGSSWLQSLDQPDLVAGHLEQVRAAAKRASELKDHQDAAILDTLARVHYELGNLADAIKWQRQAVEKNQGRHEIDATLEKYLAEQASGADAS